ncbi:MAG: hypothetical protein ACJ8ER_02210 [Allosphingosinicella sp.]
MNSDQLSGLGASAAAGGRKAWTKPSLTPLRAGRAEAIPGVQISDATLEAIGS